MSKWSWMMDYCKQNGLPPAQSWAWEQAEKEYYKRVGWKPLNFSECPECGSSLDVYTDGDGSWVYDGDPVRCTECEFSSGISVDEDQVAWVQ